MTLAVSISQRQAPDGLQSVRFDEREAAPFIHKSVSAETRASYARALAEFFDFCEGLHPTRITPAHVAAYRDRLAELRRRPATIAQKLSVVRSFFSYLQAAGAVHLNPASTKLVTAPRSPSDGAGRALTRQEARNLLAGPHTGTPEGARDHCLMLLMLRLGLRLAEVCNLRASSIRSTGRGWILTSKVKGGREETWPLLLDVKLAVDNYLRLDAARRRTLGTDREDAWLFQPVSNFRTLVYDKPISPRQVQKVVRKWGEYTGVGRVTPHDLRRTIVTLLLEDGLSYRDVQMVTKHRDPKTIMRYDKARENLERNPVSTFNYDVD